MTNQLTLTGGSGMMVSKLLTEVKYTTHMDFYFLTGFISLKERKCTTSLKRLTVIYPQNKKLLHPQKGWLKYIH